MISGYSDGTQLAFSIALWFVWLVLLSVELMAIENGTAIGSPMS
jgi:hypothetical protein